MRRRVVIGSLVALAIALVLWMKPDRSANSPTGGEPTATSTTTQVLLFADPREAESSCGCGEIIRMVRGADEPGVLTVLEFDPQRDSQAVRQHSVRVAPTVIIAGGDGVERARFEGESPDVIADLRTALDAVDPG